MTDGMMAADTLRALADDWEDRSCGLYVHPESLRHAEPEPPDSWERIEEDARAMIDDGLHPNGEWVLDLLSRARALTERGER